MRIETNEHKYKSTRHTVYACEYHVLWCTKYRRAVLSPDMQERLKSLILEAQDPYDYVVRAVETMPDHVHLLVSISPSVPVGTVVGRIKGYCSRYMREEFPQLKSRLPSLWTRSKFIATTGGVTLETLKQYVENQKGV